ncbi:uncharacterized protein BP01DRAFT_420581 [Aspergillus saccharolyticus JOP 1030-1]|uniref:Uncharacterized protein n=1 Tax=Aspergillus saccharolyticus JOP 1030-1 TaxID=1450539 RepID=A0A318ZML7_9EURO|nr:hypothetical protein BP01DRAFT_420581 [Aspergillus saccharolyticus JOP 1030-1]PYH48839.1 hypothetical protein BP01DRAFT_420581 [Aspergillus saccharolyticus JOP 1030-1]
MAIIATAMFDYVVTFVISQRSSHRRELELQGVNTVLHEPRVIPAWVFVGARHMKPATFFMPRLLGQSRAFRIKPERYDNERIAGAKHSRRYHPYCTAIPVVLCGHKYLLACRSDSLIGRCNQYQYASGPTAEDSQAPNSRQMRRTAHTHNFVAGGLY